MEKLDPEYVKFVLKTLMQAVARERVENYALRIVLADAKISSLEDQDKAREISSRRYAKLLELAGLSQLPKIEDPQSEPDYLDLLKAFEGPIQ